MHSKLVAPVLALAACVFIAARSAPGSDCNRNGIDDSKDISGGASRDCNANGVPDECEKASGDIVFEMPRPIPGFLEEPGSFFAEDFDGDGDADIAAAVFKGIIDDEGNQTGTVQSILFVRNEGGGRFAEPVRTSIPPLHPADAHPWRLHVADLDRDGNLDLLVTCEETRDVPVLLNDGAGNFDVSVQDVIPIGTVSVVLGDFDGDGFTDLAGGINGAMPWLDVPRPGMVSVAWNLGSGRLASAEDHPVFTDQGSGVYTLIAADLEPDGDLDLVAAEQNCDEAHGPGTRVAVLGNLGGRRFSAPAFHEVGDDPKQMAAADLDGDHDMDILIWRYKASELSVLRNIGGGAFEVAPPISLPYAPDGFRLQDIDGDGDPDLAIGWGVYQESERSGKFSFLLNDGGGAFGSAITHELANTHCSCPSLADLNGDGLPDALVPSYPGGAIIFQNRGAGTFERVTTVPTGWSVVRDMDGDGDKDLLGAVWGVAPLAVLANATGGDLALGCEPFLRGDANADGAVSISDVLTLRRFRNGDIIIDCMDAADASDDEMVGICDSVTLLDALFWRPDWPLALPAPSAAPGHDPTPTFVQHDWSKCGTQDHGVRVGCVSYRPEPPVNSGDFVIIGDIVASPGTDVFIPIYLTASVSVDAVQLVLRYDPAIEFTGEQQSGKDVQRLDMTGTWLPDGQDPLAAIPILTVHREASVVTIAISGGLFDPRFDIPPGVDVPIAFIAARISPDAVPGTTLRLSPVTDEGGVGPFHLRNEISFQGGSRLVSVIPHVEEGRMSIVPDQAFFFKRGDTTGDGRMDISDAVRTLGVLFLGGAFLPCEDAADANDDGKIDIADPIVTLSFLFLGGAQLPDPYARPGLDPTPDGLRCFRFFED